jgi:hypothetical protein
MVHIWVRDREGENNNNKKKKGDLLTASVSDAGWLVGRGIIKICKLLPIGGIPGELPKANCILP